LKLNKLARLTASLVLATFLTGCGDSPEEAARKKAERSWAEGQAKIEQEKVLAEKAKKEERTRIAKVPFDQYHKMDPMRMEFLYAALSDGKDISEKRVENLIKSISFDESSEVQALVINYFTNNDAFFRKEVREKIDPILKKKLGESDDYRYVYVERPVELKPYDFDKKGFLIDENNRRTNLPVMFGVDRTINLHDQKMNVKLDVRVKSAAVMPTNRDEFMFFPVGEVEKAKKIESIRSETAFNVNENFRYRYYFYIHEIGTKSLVPASNGYPVRYLPAHFNAEIIKSQLLWPVSAGRGDEIVAEYTGKTQ